MQEPAPDITDTGFGYLKKCAHLKSFEIEGCEISQKVVLSLIKKSHSLHSLTIEHCSTIRDEGLDILYSQIMATAPQLEISLH